MTNEKDVNDPNYFYNLWEAMKATDILDLPEIEDEGLEEKILIPEESGDYYMKIILAGDGAVGKTSLRRRYLGEGFSTNYQQTIGADFAIHQTQIGSYKVKIVIWDLAGQLMFHQVRSTFYKGTHGALIVCDITNQTSFENLKHWISELWKNNRPVPFTIVGNKCDLEDTGIPYVEEKRIHTVAKIINNQTLQNYRFGTKSMITSAKTGEGVKEAFKQLAIQIIAYQRFQEKLQSQNK